MMPYMYSAQPYLEGGVKQIYLICLVTPGPSQRQMTIEVLAICVIYFFPTCFTIRGNQEAFKWGSVTIQDQGLQIFHTHLLYQHPPL